MQDTMPTRYRIGSVSYLNARPLIYGLQECADIDLRLDVPARLLDGLREGRCDVALLPVIDYQAMADLCIVPSGGIGCDGPTLTVRIFSSVAIDAIRTLACDAESHTSVALARIILRQRYGLSPELIAWRPQDEGGADAILMIGDKVVCAEPRGAKHQLDLGQAWKELTGLPFVFAVWTARAGVDLGDLPRRLTAARERGMRNVERIIEEHAVPRGWPAALAREYLTSHLKFEIGAAQIEAIGRFHAMAAEHGLIAGAVRGLRVYM
jgi:chorismate dehydratase